LSNQPADWLEQLSVT